MDSSVKFVPYDGDSYGLQVNENYLVFRWTGSGKVLFSVTRKGDAAYAHFVSDKGGLKHIKQAFNEFIEFTFWLFDWCKMVLATTDKPSIGRVLLKCGFSRVAESEGVTLYMRWNDGR